MYYCPTSPSGWAGKKKRCQKNVPPKASYAGGNLTDTLTFRYTVVEGDHTDTFDILDTRTTRRQRFSTALVRPAVAEVSIFITLHTAINYA